MKNLSTIAAILMLSALPALADFETVSIAYEIKAQNLSIPTTQNSRIRFSECDECEPKSARLTPNTSYTLNGRRVRFEKFRQALRSFGDSEKGPVILLHHLESDTVVSVSVTLD